jgi:hypothetical protein
VGGLREAKAGWGCQAGSASEKTPAVIILAAAALLLAACQSGPKDYLEYRSPQDPVTVAARIAENVGRCWFAGGREGFSALAYSPELTSYSDRPRVLIVPKAEPHGLPRLVIEASRAKRGASVKLFGPMLASGEAPALARDVERWAGGGSGCA